MNIFVAIICLIIGMGLILSNRVFAKIIIKEQNNTWGFKFGETQIKLTRILSILVGMAFIIFAIASQTI